MPRIITYSLHPQSSHSDEYYETIAIFVQKWSAKVKQQTAHIVSGFHRHLQTKAQPDRSDDEIAFELLTLGVIILEHGHEFNRLSTSEKWFLPRLVLVQNRWPLFEPVIKALRGLINGLSKKQPFTEQKETVIENLVAWLIANGETTKADRFCQWRDFIHEGDAETADETVKLSMLLANEFSQESTQDLGKYTEMVDQFLLITAPKHRWQYDHSFVTKTRLEYHLGMLGTELLNWVQRRSFLNTAHKVVLLPPCMSAPSKSCKATETSMGAKCAACTPTCRVNQITKLGVKKGFEVFMIPDDMHGLSSRSAVGKVGVVGISCALTNWNGGWETSMLGIPAQGILLDYVGCKFHWDKYGIPTDTNINQLISIINGKSQE
jgi:uncharacterized protein